MGTREDKLYHTWCNMKARCYEENRSDYKYYGGRGIKVCDEWKNDFFAFRKWSEANGYVDFLNLEIDRINNDGDYCPKNCRWSTLVVQHRNRSDNHFITIHGIAHCLSEWCEIYDIKHQTFESRIKRGWSKEKALTKPVRKYKK
ncbi:hypothetical protein AGMMS49944_15680 [Spirochaetia bacterium]|nr:hypothetical protein AGMMS49944_15680 [Spirochaetia bacterium]